MQPILSWWLLSTLIGLAALPLTFSFFRRFPGRGYPLARTLGLLLTAYLLWLGASLHILQNNPGGILTALGLVSLLSAVCLAQNGAIAGMRETLRANGPLILTTELIFILGFFAWALVRAYAPYKVMPAGGEKFMEMAFLNGVMNSPAFPPLDPWLSGFSIAYYYFGYVMMGLMAQITATSAGVAFDLYDAFLFGLTAQAAFGLVHALTGSRSNRPSLAVGLLAALLTGVMGNLLGIFEALYARGWLPLSFAAWLAVPSFPAEAMVTGSFDPGGGWWWWRASRVLNDLNLSGQSIPLNPITEFPLFSFLLGDNHPHKLALPFGLLAIAGAYALLLEARSGQRLSMKRLALSAVITGSLIFLNTWDTPVVFGLAVLAWLAGLSLAAGALKSDHLKAALRFAAWLLAGILACYALFLTSFSSQAGGILPYTFPPTRLVQYLIMFGPFIFILACFLSTSLAHGNGFTLRRWLGWWLRLMAALLLLQVLLILAAGLVLWVDGLRGGSLAAEVLPLLGSDNILLAAGLMLARRLSDPWLFMTLTALISAAAAGLWAALQAEPEQPTADSGLFFARLLALAGLALTFSVEFFYLRDGFGVRMNTVFKFYFQGWVLLAAASAYGLWWMRNHLQGWLRVLPLAIAGLLVAAGMVYPLLGIWNRADQFAGTPDLDAAAQMRRENPDDFAAIDWLVEEGRLPDGALPVLLEAPGKSYNYAGRMSAFTGYPAVLGWAIHEMQWRGNYTEQGRREPLIAEIYTTPDAPTALTRLQELGVNYIILGTPERDYIREQCSNANQLCNPAAAEEKFARAFVKVFESGSTSIFAVPPSNSHTIYPNLP